MKLVGIVGSNRVKHWKKTTDCSLKHLTLVCYYVLVMKSY